MSRLAGFAQENWLILAGFFKIVKFTIRPRMNRVGYGKIMGNLMNEVMPLTRFIGFL